MNRLVFAGRDFSEFRSRLLTSQEETAAIVLSRPVRTTGGWRLLVADIVDPPADAYAKRGHDHIELRPEFLARALKRARIEKFSVGLAHTHPFPGSVAPSAVDRRGEAVLLPTVFGRVEGIPHARLIVGPEGVSAGLFTTPTSEDRLSVLQTGPDINRFNSFRGEDAVDFERFDRQVLAFGEQGQEILGGLRVGIVGLGGTGSAVAQQLAYLGVKQYVMIDPDLVETTNLNRVIGATQNDVGRPKVEVAAAAVRRIAPGATVEAICNTAILHSVLRRLLDVDVFFGCTDSHGSRAVMSQFAYQYFVPCIDMGVRIDAKDGHVDRITGRVQMLSPGLPCLICADLLDPEQVRRDLMTDAERQRDPYIVGSTIAQPAVVSLNSTVASLAVTMFASAVTGLPARARHLIVRFETGVVRAIGGDQVPECVVCSKAGALGRGDDWNRPGRL
jgi:molybdopterin-synthase adenylyltransferase